MYNMPTRVVFAQVHKSTEAVEASDAHVYELYQSSNEVSVTIADFEAAFYNNTGSFRIECQNIEDSGIPFKLNDWQTLGGDAVEVANVVLADWENDLGVETACWSTCSLMNVREQLLSADDLCKLKCNVSCCLSKEELIAALNQANEGRSGETLQAGDLVTLSVLLSNGNPSAKPVEFRLNFVLATPTP